MAVLNLKNIDDNLRNQYKSICARKGITMTDDLKNYIKWAVEKNKLIGEMEGKTKKTDC